MNSLKLQIRRMGMSLVELLVVVAILGLLAVTVIPSLANTAESRRTREAARTLQSFIAKSHSRAIGRPRWSGFLMQPIPGSYGCSDVFLADVPEPYRGDTLDASVTISGNDYASRVFTPRSPGMLRSLATRETAASVGDLIRFNGRGPNFDVSSLPSSQTNPRIGARLRGYSASANESLDYHPRNTPWPPANAPLTFEIFRSPQRAGPPMSLPENRLVDLRWSGFGPLATGRNVNMYRRLVPTNRLSVDNQLDTNTITYDPSRYGDDHPAATDVCIAFDGTGRVRQILMGSSRFPVSGPLFLLVGRADRVGQPYETLNAQDDSLGANWQYADSFWIGIDPLTGVARVAECVPDRPPFATTLAQQHQRLIASQNWIRAALSTDGR
jgi:type II secretory pathway pseudopilin PulG